MTIYFLALLMGIVAGMRTMTPPAAVSWFAYLGWLDGNGAWFDLLGNIWTRGILTILALGELVADQHPSTPSRRLPLPFGARILSGAVTGGAMGAASDVFTGGLIAGIIGAICGTLGGHALRAKLASTLGRDRPAAIIEDALAIGGAVLVGVLIR